MKKSTKIEYLAEIVAVAIMFCVIISPVFASEISIKEVIKLVNESREKQGLDPLVENENLKKVAEDKLNDMVKNNYFAHKSPSGKTPWYWFEKNGYNYQYAGENLAINFTSAEKQHSAWMASATHKKNILNPNYKEIGVAFGAGEIEGEMSLITVQEFGTRFIVAGEENEKNVAPIKDDNLIKEGGEIIPQILSVKNQEIKKTIEDSYFKNKDSLPKQVWKDPVELKKDKLKMIDLISMISTIFFLASLSLIPMVFMAVALDKIIMLHETRKHAH